MSVSISNCLSKQVVVTVHRSGRIVRRVITYGNIHSMIATMSTSIAARGVRVRTTSPPRRVPSASSPARAVTQPRRAAAAIHVTRARMAIVVSSSSSDASPSGDAAPSVGDKVKKWWSEASKIDKSKIASLGSACLLSYGFVSNVFYVTSLMLATYTAVKTTGASPLVNSLSMKTFASSYFGLWMIQNFLRPARFAFSIAISPGTDKIVEFFRKYVPNNNKKAAFALTVFCINVVGTFAYMFAGFGLIYALTGVPLELGGLLQAAKAAKSAAPV